MLRTDVAGYLSAQVEEISQDQMLERICVRPPYFALSSMRLCEGVFEAVARAEMALGAEVGPMRGAEVARHAAIAGSCAAALAQSDSRRRFYLAQEASYEGWPCTAAFGTPVMLRAEVTHLDKREARARIIATCGGRLLAQLDVRYTILTQAAFERLFRGRYVADVGAPHETVALPDSPAVWRDGALVRHVASVPVEACAGHFEHFPAMPVAVLMGQLAELAGRCLSSHAFYVARAFVQAHDLCWAGEAVEFVVRPNDLEDTAASFDCSALASTRTTGQMQLTLHNLSTVQ